MQNTFVWLAVCALGCSRANSPESGVVGATASRLDVSLEQVQQGDSVAEPIAEAGVVVLLPLDLAAHGVDDLVKQDRAVCLEDLPLQATAEDEHRSHWSAMMEAQVICTTCHSVRPCRQRSHNADEMSKKASTACM